MSWFMIPDAPTEPHLSAIDLDLDATQPLEYVDVIVSREHAALPADKDFTGKKNIVCGEPRTLYRYGKPPTVSACLWSYSKNGKEIPLRINIGGLSSVFADSTAQLALHLPKGSSEPWATSSTQVKSSVASFTLSKSWAGQGSSDIYQQIAPYGLGGEAEIIFTATTSGGPVRHAFSCHLEFYCLNADYLSLPDTLKAGIPLELLRMFVLASVAQGCKTPQEWMQLVVEVVFGSRMPYSGKSSNTTAHWLQYDSGGGSTAFSISETGDTMNVQAWLDAYKNWKIFAVRTAINCYDQAAITEIALSLGFPHDRIHWEFHQPYGFIGNTDLVGWGRCNNPYFGGDPTKMVLKDDKSPDRWAFRNHAYLSWSDKKLTDYTDYASRMKNVKNYDDYSKEASQFERDCGITMRMIDACAGPHTGTETRKEYEVKVEHILEPSNSFSKNVRDSYYGENGFKKWHETHHLGAGITAISPNVPRRARLLPEGQAAWFAGECQRVAQLFGSSGDSKLAGPNTMGELESTFRATFGRLATERGWCDIVWPTIRPFSPEEDIKIDELKVYFKKGAGQENFYFSLKLTSAKTLTQARDHLASRLTYDEALSGTENEIKIKSTTKNGVKIVGKSDSMRTFLWKNVSAEIATDSEDDAATLSLATVLAEQAGRF